MEPQLMASDTSPAIIVMAVSGAGQSPARETLPARLGCRFVEGDQLHPPSNVEKMARGTPLDDEGRWPWLDLIGQQLATAIANGENIVLSCSSLKKIYRDRLR